jgi:transcriptional regulator with XRE-family HTH domain
MSTSEPEPADVALGAAIKLRRTALGMSQDALASRAGVSFQQIQKYERGSNRVSFSRLVRIARALDCRVADLVSALDAPGAAPDAAVLALLHLPAAPTLLGLFEKLEAGQRQELVRFLSAATRSPEDDAGA